MKQTKESGSKNQLLLQRAEYCWRASVTAGNAEAQTARYSEGTFPAEFGGRPESTTLPD